MDTASHLLFGLTLAGLATLEPTVFHDPLLAEAVTFGTIIGSTAPDFDTVVRLKGFDSYLRYHRGITHSIPALFLWPLFISLATAGCFHLSNHYLSLYGWTFLSVLFHVFLDMFNTYGVQCFRPFTKKWIHLDILVIFEPFLFILHFVGAIGWLFFNLNPGLLFLWIYLLTFVYIGIRSWQHQQLCRHVLTVLNLQGLCHVIPSFHWFHWRFVVETSEAFYTGKIFYGKVMLLDKYDKKLHATNELKPVIEATLKLRGVRAFLHFAQRIHISCKAWHEGYEVSFSDVRFWYDRKLPFGVDILLDKELNVIGHTLGWRKKSWDPPFM